MSTFRIFLTLLLLSCVSHVNAGAVPPAKKPIQPTPTSTPSPAVTISRPVTNNAVVRVNSTNQAYDFFRPWMKKAPYSRRGLGVVLKDGRILVTAELIANYTYVELEKAEGAEKSPAIVEHVDYDCNLALLKPADEKFLSGMSSLPIENESRVGDHAEVLQLENNGTIASTPGVITSISVGNYPMDSFALLLFRISAPMQHRDGSFTLPVVRNGELVGLLMRYDSRSQTADVIPSPVINHFLTKSATGEFAGFARAGLAFAPTRDPQLRRYIGLTEAGGVYVTEVAPDSPASQAGLRRGDVILALNDKPVDQDGNYEDPAYGKIAFSHITNTLSQPGDKLVFTIFRGGAKFPLPLTLEARNQAAVLSDPYFYDQQPRYFILGGLVFLELSRPYLQEWGGNWAKDAPQRLVYLDAFQNEQDSSQGKIVYLSQVLPSRNTMGYENLEHLIVKKINGQQIKSLDDIAKAVKTPVDGFHKVEFDDDPPVLFLNAAETEKYNPELMDHYGMPSLQNLDTPKR